METKDRPFRGQRGEEAWKSVHAARAQRLPAQCRARVEVDDMGCPERVFVGFETPSSGAPGELPGIGVRVCSLEKEYTATIGFSFFGEVSISEVRCVYDEACGGNMSRAESIRIKSH